MTDDGSSRPPGDGAADDISGRSSAADVPDRPPAGSLAAALNLRRNGAIGVAVGLCVAIGAYLFRVLELAGPFAGTRTFPVFGPEGWFLLLAFVLASATAFLVTVGLSIVSIYRLAKNLD